MRTVFTRSPARFLAALVGALVSAPALAMDIPVAIPEPDTLMLIAIAAGAGVLTWRGRSGK